MNKKICFILSSLWLSGGVRVIVELSNRMFARGYEITIVVPRGSVDPDVLVELERNVHIIEAGQFSVKPSSFFGKLAMTWSLARVVSSPNFIVSTHTPTTIATWLTRFFNKGNKLIWLYQDYREMFIGRPLEDWLLRNALRWHDRALVVSEYSRQELLTYSPGDVVVIGEGLSHSEKFQPISKAQQIQDSIMRIPILFLGDMRPRKGLFDFLDATEILYRRGKEIILWIVSKEECQIETPVPFDYIYRPSRTQLARLYASCKLFVSASWWESFGLPSLEAMACGAPVVLTDSGGVREYAVDGHNCLMVPPKSPKSLAEAMERVLSDESLAEHLSKNGPETAKRFTWETAVDRFEKAILEVLAEKH